MSEASDGKYWKRAHRDWRVRVAAVVMAIAMVVYVLTGNLSRRPVVHRSPPVSSASK